MTSLIEVVPIKIENFTLLSINHTPQYPNPNQPPQNLGNQTTVAKSLEKAARECCNDSNNAYKSLSKNDKVSEFNRKEFFFFKKLLEETLNDIGAFSEEVQAVILSATHVMRTGSYDDLAKNIPLVNEGYEELIKILESYLKR